MAQWVAAQFWRANIEILGRNKPAEIRKSKNPSDALLSFPRGSLAYLSSATSQRNLTHNGDCSYNRKKNRLILNVYLTFDKLFCKKR